MEFLTSRGIMGNSGLGHQKLAAGFCEGDATPTHSPHTVGRARGPRECTPPPCNLAGTHAMAGTPDGQAG